MSHLIGPRSRLLVAALLSVAYAICRLAGLGRFTSFLSGTVPEGAGGLAATTTLGGLYVMVHFTFVVLVPILLISASLQWGLGALARKRPATRPPASNGSPGRG